MARKIGVGGKDISTDTGGSFAPLPAGRYEATIFQVKEGKYTTVKNKDLPNLNVQYRISDGQKGANRRLFDLVPLSPTWKDGKDAFRFFQFGAAVTGVTEKAFREKAKELAADKKGTIEIPEDSDLLGKGVTLTIKVVDDDYAFEKEHSKWEDLNDPDSPEPQIKDFQKNTISNVAVAGGGNMGEGSTPSGKTDTSSAVELDGFEL